MIANSVISSKPGFISPEQMLAGTRCVTRVAMASTAHRTASSPKSAGNIVSARPFLIPAAISAAFPISCKEYNPY